jgi:hypothetical protein
MWRIIRAEFAYNRLNYLIFLAFLLPVLAYDALRVSAVPAFLVWLFMFLMVNNWNAIRIREKRSTQLSQLPLPAISVGMARFMMIVLLSGSFLVIYGILQAILLPEAAAGVRIILCLFALTIAIFSAGLIFRDRFVGSKALGRGKMILVAAGGAGVLANIYLLILAERAYETRQVRPAFIRAIEWGFEHNPSGSNLGTAICVFVGLGLGLLSAYTFTRRRTHVE